jgi:hypothetical protein
MNNVIPIFYNYFIECECSVFCRLEGKLQLILIFGCPIKQSASAFSVGH